MNKTIPHYDVIIVGAGSIGVPAAFYLARAGVNVLVIDRVPSVGQGSNKKAIGGIRATHSDPAKIRLCLRSIAIFASWKETYGDDIEWYQGGYCFVAYRDEEEKSLTALASQQKNLGLNIKWYGCDDLLKLVPDLNPDKLRGGTFSPDDGNASPLLAAHAFYSHAERCGAQFLFNENIESIIVQNGKIKGVKTTHETFSADVVINAAGPWSKELGDMVGMNIPVHPDSHEAAITEHVARFLDPMVVDIRPSPGSSNFYFYQHITGQIVFCITPDPPIWGFDQRETSAFLPMVAKRMVEVMPRLSNLRVRRTWRGLYPMSPDGNPIVGWSKEAEGYMAATGMCGQGFMLGPGLGELIARMVTRTTMKQDEDTLAFLSPYRGFIRQEQLR